MVDRGSFQPTAGLTAEEPAAARERFEGWGLGTAERFDEAPLETVLVCGGRKRGGGRVCSAGRLRALEEKHFSLPNREGAVVYIVVKALRPPRSAPAEPPPPRVALVSQKARLRVHSTAVVSPKKSVPFMFLFQKGVQVEERLVYPCAGAAGKVCDEGQRGGGGEAGPGDALPPPGRGERPGDSP